jgi:hypothetical protein
MTNTPILDEASSSEMRKNDQGEAVESPIVQALTVQFVLGKL